MYVDLMGTEKTTTPSQVWLLDAHDRNYVMKGVICAMKINNSIENTISDIHNNFDYDAMIRTWKSMQVIWGWWITVWLSTCVVWSAVTAGVWSIPSCWAWGVIAAEWAVFWWVLILNELTWTNW